MLFAFEEAIGFMLGPMYRDKDGVSAAAVFAEMAANLYAKGATVRRGCAMGCFPPLGMRPSTAARFDKGPRLLLTTQ